MTRSLVRARWAVCAAFFVNGFVVGHWATKIPVLTERLAISESVFGRMIILFGVGALVALVIGAVLVNRLGSHQVTRWTSLMLVPSLVLLTLAPGVYTASLAMLWLGMFLGAMDNAMNANGVSVESALGRPVMSSYHGFWSLGGVSGGLTGGAMISLFGEMGHAVLVSTIMAVIALGAWPFLHADVSDEPPLPETVSSGWWRRLPRQGGLYVLAIVTMLAFSTEGTVIDWSALYLSDELNASLTASGYAFAAFSTTMALVRLLGDRVRARYGDRLTFTVSALLGSTGMSIAGLSGNIVLVCLGFLVAGLGMANLVPILFSSAGRYPGVKPAVGIAVITIFGYGGLMFIPAFIGYLAEHLSFSAVFAGWGLILAALAIGAAKLPNLSGRS